MGAVDEFSDRKVVTMLQKGKCIFCEESVVTNPPNGRAGIEYDCPICGSYFVDEIVYDQLKGDLFFITNKLKYAQLLAERNIQKKGHIDISLEIIAELLEYYPTDSLEVLDRALLNLSALIKHPGDVINIPINCIHPIPLGYPSKRCQLLLFSDEEQYPRILKQMESDGWINLNSTSQDRIIQITSKGWEHIKEIKSGKKMTIENNSTINVSGNLNYVGGDMVNSQIHQITNQVIAGNIESLKQHLLSQGFKQDDVDALEDALNQDKENGKYSIRSHVQGWFETIKQKCIECVYTVPHDVLVGVATAAILKLIGI